MKFNLGEKVVNIESGVIGYVFKFYTPTACEEQIMVSTEDGRKYSAPASTWVLCTEGVRFSKYNIDLENAVKEIEKEHVRCVEEAFLRILDKMDEPSIASTSPWFKERWLKDIENKGR